MNYGTREEFYGSSSPVAALRSRFEQPTPFNSPVKAVNVDTFKPVRSDTPRLNRFQSLNPSQASLGVFADRPALTAPLASRRPAAMLRRFLSEETVKKTGSAGDENTGANGLMSPPLVRVKNKTIDQDMKRKFDVLEVKPLAEAGQEAIMKDLETDMAALKSEVGELVEQRMEMMRKKVESRLAQA